MREHALFTTLKSQIYTYIGLCLRKVKVLFGTIYTVHFKFILFLVNLYLYVLFPENYDKASEILTNLEKLVPNMLQVAYRRINLERRRNNLDKVCTLYEHYINSTKNKVISNNMAIKYARFCWKVRCLLLSS